VAKKDDYDDDDDDDEDDDDDMDTAPAPPRDAPKRAAAAKNFVVDLLSDEDKITFVVCFLFIYLKGLTTYALALG